MITGDKRIYRVEGNSPGARTDESGTKITSGQYSIFFRALWHVDDAPK